MVVDTIKSVLSTDTTDTNTFECNECDATFDSANEPDSFWLECIECGADDVSLLTHA